MAWDDWARRFQLNEIKSNIEEFKLIDEHKNINFEILKKILMFILYWSQPHKSIGYTWPDNSKIFIYCLYSIIVSTKQKCKELLNLFENKDGMIQYHIKWSSNTWVYKKEEIELYIKETQNCYYRFSIYETMLKTILLIDPKEVNEANLIQKFPIYKNITFEEHELLIEFIINPIFYGNFSSKLKDTNFIIVENGNLKEIKFPFQLNYNEKEDQFPDALTIFLILQNLGATINFSKQHIQSWFGTIDHIISSATGKPNDYIYDYGKYGKQAYDTAVGVAGDISNVAKTIKSTIYHSSTNVSDITDALKPIAALVSIGFVFSIMNKFSD